MKIVIMILSLLAAMNVTAKKCELIDGRDPEVKETNMNCDKIQDDLDSYKPIAISERIDTAYEDYRHYDQYAGSKFNGIHAFFPPNHFYFTSHTNDACLGHDPVTEGVFCARNELGFVHDPSYYSYTSFTLNIVKLERDFDGYYPYVLVWQTGSKLTPAGNYPQAALSVTNNSAGGLKLVMTTNYYALDAQDQYDYFRQSITLVEDFKLRQDYPIILTVYPGLNERTGMMVANVGSLWAISQRFITNNSNYDVGHTINFGQYWEYGFNINNDDNKQILSLMTEFKMSFTK